MFLLPWDDELEGSLVTAEPHFCKYTCSNTVSFIIILLCGAIDCTLGIFFFLIKFLLFLLNGAFLRDEKCFYVYLSDL